MPIDFQQDDAIARTIDIYRNRQGWGTRVQGILDGALGTDNPFNDAALLDAGTAAGNVPVIPEGGVFDDALLKPATTLNAGAVKTSGRTSEASSDGFPLVMLLSALSPLLNIDAINLDDFRVFSFNRFFPPDAQAVIFQNQVLSRRRGFLVLGGSGIYEGLGLSRGLMADQSRGIEARPVRSAVTDRFYVFGGQRLESTGVRSVGIGQQPPGYTTRREPRVIPPQTWHRGGIYLNGYGSAPKTTVVSSQTSPVTDRVLGTGDLAILLLDGSQDALSLISRDLDGPSFAPRQFSEFAFFIQL